MGWHVKIPPSEGGRDGTSLNVGKDIVGKQPENSGQGLLNASEVVCDNPLGEVLSYITLHQMSLKT